MLSPTQHLLEVDSSVETLGRVLAFSTLFVTCDRLSHYLLVHRVILVCTGGACRSVTRNRCPDLDETRLRLRLSQTG